MNRPNDQRGFVHKRILGAVSGFAGSVFAGGNPLLGAASGFARGGQRAPGQVSGQLPAGSRVQIPTPGFAGRVQRFLPGGGTGFTTLPPGLTPTGPGGLIGLMPGVSGGVTGFAQAPTDGVCPPAVGNRRINAAGLCAPAGFHWNVSGYFRKGGPCSRFEPGFVEMGTVLVKNRRMNNANGGAQDKALKRIERGQDHAKRILRATGWRTISKQSGRELKMRKRTRH